MMMNKLPRDKGLEPKHYYILQTILEEEDKRQLDKWGYQKRTPAEWMMFLTEEVGELAEAIAEQQYRNGDIEHVLREAQQVLTLTAKIFVMYNETKDNNRRRSE